MVNAEQLESLRKSKAKEIEKISSIKEMIEYIYKYRLDCCLTVRDYIKDFDTLDMYNAAIDTILKTELNLLLDKYNNCYKDFYPIFSENNYYCKYLFKILEIRFKENSQRLNENKFINLLYIYNQYLIIEKYIVESNDKSFLGYKKLSINISDLLNEKLDGDTLKKKKNLTSKN